MRKIFPSYYTFVSTYGSGMVTILAKNTIEGERKYRWYLKYINYVSGISRYLYDIYDIDYPYPGRENIERWHNDSI